MNLTKVLTDEGKTISEQVEFSKDFLEMPDGQYPITQKSPFDVEAVSEGEKVLGLKCSGTLTVLIPCARCLDEVEVKLDIDFNEKIDMTDPQSPVLVPDEDDKDEGGDKALENIDFIHGYQLDVDRLVCGEALLNWPSQVLCSDNCKGLCRVCGQNLNRKTCSCDRAEVDPRMAKIRDIFRLANQEE